MGVNSMEEFEKMVARRLNPKVYADNHEDYSTHCILLVGILVMVTGLFAMREYQHFVNAQAKPVCVIAKTELRK